MMDKAAELRKLAALRCSDQTDGYTHPEDHGYDFTDLVSPNTRTAGNADAEIMIVLQDWASADGLRKLGYREEIQRLGHYPKLRTNIRLKRLRLKHFGLSLEHIYGTNAFPFVKPLE